MFKFFLKLFAFLIILFLILAVLEKGLFTIPNSYSLKRDCLEKNLSKLELLIFGSSQAYYGLNPADFSANSCNLANSNQDLYYDSKILDKYIDRLGNLKIVYITVSYFSLEFKLENTEEAWRKFFYYLFFKIKDRNFTPLDIKNYSLIALYTPKNSLSYILKGFKVNLAEGSTSEGWKRVDKGEFLPTEDGKSSAVRQTGYMDSHLTAFNLSVLEHMIQVLARKGVKAVIITPPVTRDYYENINIGKYQDMQRNISALAERYSVRYLNYFKDERFLNSDFLDNADHLNESGAKKFAKIISNE